jgi:transposase
MKNSPTLNRFCHCSSIGIDVSKASLEVVGLEGDAVWRTEIDNSRVSIETLAKALSQGSYCGKIICESTGHYHLLLGLVFARYELDLRIINPLQSSKHQKARIRKTKTDRVDGYVLATMCTTERDLPKAAQLQPEQVLMRLKQGQLHALDKQIQQMSRSLATYTETYQQLDLATDISAGLLQQVLTDLKAAKRQLQKELETLFVGSAVNAKDIDRVRSLPGFSPMVAGLVSTVFDREVKSDRSWIAFSGLDISVRQSGTWQGKGRLTKRGNSYIRKRLYCAAWGATMNYEEVRKYYDTIKATGRNHVEALCIIARKLLRIAYAVLVKGKTYDAKIAFPV